MKARAAAVCITEEIIDVALRMGLEWLADGRRPRSKPFRTEPLDLGACLVRSIDDVTDVP